MSEEVAAPAPEAAPAQPAPEAAPEVVAQPNGEEAAEAAEAAPSSKRGDEGILEGVTIGEDEENYSSDDGEEEEGIVIHASRTAQRRTQRKSFGKLPVSSPLPHSYLP
jgi:hypothetical protein